MKAAVADGVKSALSDPETVTKFWDGAFEVLNRHASQKTGELVLGGLKGLLKRGAIFLVVGLVVYNVGGWAALVALWKSVVSSGH